jgi:hypothetical protein
MMYLYFLRSVRKVCVQFELRSLFTKPGGEQARGCIKKLGNAKPGQVGSSQHSTVNKTCFFTKSRGDQRCRQTELLMLTSGLSYATTFNPQ